MSTPSHSFYIKNSPEVLALLKQAGVKRERPLDDNAEVLYVGSCGEYWNGAITLYDREVKHLPQDQATVYNLLNLPLPTSNMQQEFNVGDRVRVLPHCQLVTYLGNVYPIVKELGEDGQYGVQINSELVARIKSTSLELVSVNPLNADTIYLSGTPGQLEGFRKDWLRAGYVATNTTTPIMGAGPQGDMLMLSFIQEPQLTVVGYAHRSESIPVLENWQALLDRAAEHVKNQTVAPVKIAGREVKLEDGLVKIGCRKTLRVNSVIKTLLDIEELQDQGLNVSFIAFGEYKITRTEANHLLQWLEEKN